MPALVCLFIYLRLVLSVVLFGYCENLGGKESKNQRLLYFFIHMFSNTRNQNGGKRLMHGEKMHGLFFKSSVSSNHSNTESGSSHVRISLFLYSEFSILRVGNIFVLFCFV